jgi:hypothetical protein
MQGIFLHTLEHHIGALVDYDLPALIDRHIRESLVLFAGLHFQFGPRQQLIHEQLHLQRGRVRGPPISGLYAASATALRRCDPTGRRTNPVAAIIRSTKEKSGHDSAVQ